MITKPATIDELLDYWPGNIPFKGRLVSKDGSCMCAQGQALHFLDGLTVDELRDINQGAANLRVAKLFGISLAHSILLRNINDKLDGAPSCVIRNPEQVLGDQSQVVLAFWRHLDRMTPAAWKAAGARAWGTAWAAAWAAAWALARAGAGAAAGVGVGAAAWEAVWEAVWETVGETAWAGAGEAAGAGAASWAGAWAAAWATNEIQGAVSMRANNRPFFFLSLFGFSDPESVIASSV